MGGGKGGGMSNQQAEQAQAHLATSLSGLLQQQQGQSNQLFQTAFPGMQHAEQFYGALASGSPNLLAAVTAPAAQQVTAATAGAQKNILENAPAGGERNLALENTNVAQGAQIGQLASQGYLSAQNALAQLGGQGIGLGQGAASTAIGAGQAAGQQYSNIVQQNIQQKGATLGALGGLGSDFAGLGTAGITAASQKGGAAGGAGAGAGLGLIPF